MHRGRGREKQAVGERAAPSLARRLRDKCGASSRRNNKHPVERQNFFFFGFFFRFALQRPSTKRTENFWQEDETKVDGDTRSTDSDSWPALGPCRWDQQCNDSRQIATQSGSRGSATRRTPTRRTSGWRLPLHAPGFC